VDYLVEMRILGVLLINEIIECNKKDNHWFKSEKLTTNNNLYFISQYTKITMGSGYL
jgi:hypothetical protein